MACNAVYEVAIFSTAVTCSQPVWHKAKSEVLLLLKVRQRGECEHGTQRHSINYLFVIENMPGSYPFDTGGGVNALIRHSTRAMEVERVCPVCRIDH